MSLRRLLVGGVLVLAGAALVVGIWVRWSRGPDWGALLEAKYGRKAISLDRETFHTPFHGDDGSLVRAAWVQWEGGNYDLLGLPAYELRDPQEVVRRADLLRAEEWRLWCFRVFYLGEPDPWQAKNESSVASGLTLGPHVGDTISAHVQKVKLGDSYYTGPETPHCEFRFTSSGWTLRKVEVFKR